MLHITLGTAPCNWNNEDVPDYRAWTPYPALLDEMVAAGYTASEVATTLPAEAELIRRDFTARGLRPASTFCAVNLRDPALHETEIAQAEERARFLASLGVDILIIADSGDERRRALAGQVRPEDGLAAAAWHSLATGLEKLAERCLRHGVRIAFHNHVGTYVETEQELIRLLESTSPTLVGLCFDVGHMMYAGGDVMALAERFTTRIWYVHLKDVDPAVLEQCRREHLGFHEALRLGIFPEIGTGCVDFQRFFAALDTIDYQGWVIVEQDTTMKTPLESARLNREYLRQAFGI